MSLGENIKNLREKAGLTQKDLADKLFVTSQAVSRWEQNNVEPNIDTLNKMAIIFKVTLDELISGIKPNEPVVPPTTTPPVTDTINVNVNQGKQVACVCNVCQKPIYVDEPIHRSVRNDGDGHMCHECYERIRAMHNHANKVAMIKGIIFGILATVAGWFVADFVVDTMVEAFNLQPFVCFIITLLSAYGIGGFVYCLFAKNTFLEDLFGTIFEYGFVKFPGLIFALDLDGILWFITVKLIFGVISFLIGAFFLILGFLVCSFLAIFVFPFSLRRSILMPEKFDRGF